jgi:hypothetical protein
MKKFFVFITSVLLMIGVNACNSCSNNTTSGEPVTVENLVSLDRQDMFLNYGENYKWYETSVVLKNYLDEENDGEISGVSNIFQVLADGDKGTDVHVVMFTHVGETKDVQVVHSFWVEDFPLNDEEIVLTFAEAYDRLMQANVVKPHSRQVVLRKEIGPKAANPQWIFGNTQQHVYVDAVTGDVKTENPVFDGLNLTTLINKLF